MPEMSSIHPNNKRLAHCPQDSGQAFHYLLNETGAQQQFVHNRCRFRSGHCVCRVQLIRRIALFYRTINRL